MLLIMKVLSFIVISLFIPYTCAADNSMNIMPNKLQNLLIIPDG